MYKEEKLMKRHLRTVFCILLSVAMLFSLLSCNSVKSNKTESNGLITGTLPIVKTPITLTILAFTQSSFNLTNQLPFYKELAKKTNININIQLLPLTDYTQKFNLIMASGALPDMVNWGVMSDIAKYGSEGAFIPLEGYLKSCKNIKAVLTNPPIDNLPYSQSILGDITSSDGHIYSIPCLGPTNTIGAVFAIRTDWLTKLGDKVPTTTNELEKVLMDFKTKDPNGNGKADEIPYVVNPNTIAGTWNSIFPLINSFGAHIDLYLDSKTDTIKFGPMDSTYKDGMTYVNKLYSEGLIDKQYANATTDLWTSEVTGNLGGMTFLWPGSGLATVNSGLQKLSKDYKMEALVPVKGPTGIGFKDTYTTGTLCPLRMSITKSNKYPLETMKLVDYLFSKDGSTLVNYGIEGTNYTMVNGKPTYTDNILKNPDGKSPELAKTSQGLKTTIFPWWDSWEPEMEAFTPTAPWTVDCWTKYSAKGVIEAPLPNLSITDQDAVRELTDIRTYRDEIANGMLTGKVSISTYDQLTSKLKTMGIDNVLKVYNDAYKKYKTNVSKLSLK